jgi:hypothetical protein
VYRNEICDVPLGYYAIYEFIRKQWLQVLIIEHPFDGDEGKRGELKKR